MCGSTEWLLFFKSQHVCKSTRGKNILDLIISSEPNIVEEVEVQCLASNSDHNVILFKVNYSMKPRDAGNKVYSYERGNYNKIGEELNRIDWEKELGTWHNEEGWKFFLNQLIRCRDIYIPERKIAQKKYPKWMGKSIQKMIF